ncbi:MAG TPA: amidohydrolase family protein [Candidatus Limnocylindria bacterium]|jgi:enamidase|nr:amidohydrolase family protein [Candidatus Limnocylindria bacterium]
MTTVLFRNIGTLLSGDLAAPVLDAASLLIEDGLVRAIGTAGVADVEVDVRGATVAPGLWDSHIHPYFGEYAPRQDAFGTIGRMVRSGVTSAISAGAGHQPGMYLPSPKLPNVQAQSHATHGRPERARDAAGTKALAIVMTKAWRNERPSGLKLYAETVFAEDGMTEEDFAELWDAGIRRLKFQRPISRAADAERYRQWAHDRGMLVLAHTGNRSLIRDIEDIGESLRVIHPDVASHVNGGPTPAPWPAIEWLATNTAATLEVAFIGNLPLARRLLRLVLDRGELPRVTIGSDLPGGTGVVPGAILRTLQLLSHLLPELPVEQLVCLATGNTARRFGLPGGVVAPGEPADIVVWDPVEGSVTETFLECVAYGDRAYPGLVMIDGAIVEHGNPLLLDPKRPPIVTRRTTAAGEAGAMVSA